MAQLLEFFSAAGEVWTLTYNPKKDLSSSLVATEPLAEWFTTIGILDMEIIKFHFSDTTKFYFKIMKAMDECRSFSIPTTRKLKFKKDTSSKKEINKILNFELLTKKKKEILKFTY